MGDGKNEIAHLLEANLSSVKRHEKRAPEYRTAVVVAMLMVCLTA